MIKLGEYVRDTLSGCEGTVVAITEWLYGCRRVVIQPEGTKESGGPLDQFVVDEPQCVLLRGVAEPEPEPEPKPERKHGGRDDSAAARRR